MMTAGKMTSNGFLLFRCLGVLHTLSASLHDQLGGSLVLKQYIGVIEVSMLIPLF